jgi:hypothetical protein
MASSRSQVAGPDFICIGMPKAGTGWLFDQLNTHPDFWMPPVKGLHYLGRKNPRMTNATKRLVRSSRGRSLAWAKGRDGDERDYEFLREAASYSGQPSNLARYASLFRHKGEFLSGDITAAYADLREHDISEIARDLPQVKIILLIRDPVARAWSRLSMAHRRREFDAALLDDADGLRGYLNSAKCVAEERSLPTRILARWSQHAPKLQFRHFLFDDIQSEPEKVRRDVLLYLRADPDKDSGKIPAGHNHKASAAKLVLTDQVRGILVEHFRDELVACAELFGGHARNWLTRYGL